MEKKKKNEGGLKLNGLQISNLANLSVAKRDYRRCKFTVRNTCSCMGC